MTTAKTKSTKSAPPRAAKTTRTRKVAPAVPRYSEQYERALKEYEKGIQLVQKKQYAEAQAAFRGIVETFPGENEICDRALSYLAICREKLDPKKPRPESVADHFHLGVYHLNRADTPAALRELERAAQMEPGNDMVRYAIASAYALAGDKARAIGALQEAIRLNEKNRVFAQSDPDFEKIRDEHEFIQLVEPEDSGAE